MLKISTEILSAWGPLPIRIALGVIFIAHGGQKLFGLWGGARAPGNLGHIRAQYGNPTMAYLNGSYRRVLRRVGGSAWFFDSTGFRILGHRHAGCHI